MKKILLSIITVVSVYCADAQQIASLTLRAQPSDPVIISKHIYGHFSEHLGRCIYDGFWVSPNSTVPNKGRIRMDIVAALKKINIPNLRWPGGCFADEYHWRDGIGAPKKRPKMINTNWGGVTEDNSFGTHEFLELCQLLRAEPYICGNVGSGTVEEMSKWVEYLNFNGDSPMTRLRSKNGRKEPWKVSFWGVGNENWGCGGNMKADYYASLYNRYATFAKNYPGTNLKKIAGGPNVDDYNWTETLMKNISNNRMWGMSLHYYVVPGVWKDKGSATQFDERQYFSAMQKAIRMDTLIQRHSAIMDKIDPSKKVALVVDEWGIWTNVEAGTNPGFLYQQNSMRDALIAGATLNIFNSHADRVKMANLAQTVNVLQALILTEKNKMLLTPTYHVFDLYKIHQDAKLIPVALISPQYEFNGQKIDAISVSASIDSLGVTHISLVNMDSKKSISLRTVVESSDWKNVSGQIITSSEYTDHNTFEQPDKIVPKIFNGASKKGDHLEIILPPLSVVVLALN
ncbi:alpha-N-arabinofuranosidase [Pedobacter frigidisoli]|uniref:alpha-N-arabinofuranosidase n=1 Tax=Pedobacter frigidisoli TaxID=2530455 RepID=UPI00292DAC54|nr:alpha-L-arabinofuranosidase C-terminal domain-containing protein [Pedobacter frigidisoli]